MNVKLVLVGTEGEINLGMALRLAANFEVSDVVLVSPKAKISEEVLRFAARGAALADKVKIVERFEEAFEEGELRVCTSSIASLGSDLLRQAASPEELVSLWSETGAKVALVFGRESTGLTREELAKCDVLVKIPASESYPTLNLTHAIAILLYELYKSSHKKPQRAYASRETLERLKETFAKLAEAVLHDKTSVERAALAFDRVLKRSLPSESEARAIFRVLARVRRRLECSSC